MALNPRRYNIRILPEDTTVRQLASLLQRQQSFNMLGPSLLVGRSIADYTPGKDFREWGVTAVTPVETARDYKAKPPKYVVYRAFNLVAYYEGGWVMAARTNVINNAYGEAVSMVNQALEDVWDGVAA